MRILIVTGGSIDEDFAARFISSEKFDINIIVDGALNVVNRLLIWKKCLLKIHHLVGDFDSADPDVLGKYIREPEITVHKFKPEKDNTDTELAVGLAMDLCRNQEGEIYILGATGTRLDHLLANIHLMIRPFNKGIPCCIVDKNNRVRLITDTYKILKNNQWGKYISLLPLDPVLRGIDLTGFKYLLQNKTVSLGDSLCISNELLEDEGVITIRDGIAILVESSD